MTWKRILSSVLWLGLPLAAFGQAPFPFQLSLTQGGITNSIGNAGVINFASIGPGQASTARLVLTYLGVSDLTATAVFNNAPVVLGSLSFTVVASDSFPKTLSRMDTLTFDIKYLAFSPIGSAPASAQMSLPYLIVSGITSTAGLLTLNFVGTTPELSVNYVFPTDGNVLLLTSGGTILFPDTPINTNSSATIAITNRGSGAGSVGAIAVSGPGFQPLGLPGLPASVPAGSVLQFSIRYSPKQTEVDTGSLQMTLAGNSFTATLQGTGISSSLAYQLLQPGGPVAIMPGQTITLPDTKVGSKSSVDVLVRNSGTAPGTITSIAFSGTGFAITDGPQVPVTLNPNDSFTITITFAPQQPGPATGRLRFNNDAFNLASNGIGSQLIYSYMASSVMVTVAPGNAVVFSQQKVGQSSTVSFTVQNTGTAPATVVSVGTALAAGSAQSLDVFTVGDLPPLPAVLNPGDSLTFPLVFSPDNTGLATSNLLVDTAVFLLSGLGTTAVPIPAYSFSGAQGAQAPFQQPAIGLSLSSAYPLPLKGVLRLTQDAGTLAPDPAVQFATSGQTLNFTIPANSTTAVFPNGLKQGRLQMGSVATTITIAPSFSTEAGLDLTPASPLILQLTFAPGVPQLLTAAISSEASNSFTLVLTGYTTSRSVSALQFQFTAASDVNIPSAQAVVDASGASAAWFQSSQSQAFGGQFTISVPFNIQVSSGTLSSPITKLQSVSMTATNQLGSSNSLTVTIP